MSPSFNPSPQVCLQTGLSYSQPNFAQESAFVWAHFASPLLPFAQQLSPNTGRVSWPPKKHLPGVLGTGFSFFNMQPWCSALCPSADTLISPPTPPASVRISECILHEDSPAKTHLRVWPSLRSGNAQWGGCSSGPGGGPQGHPPELLCPLGHGSFLYCS